MSNMQIKTVGDNLDCLVRLWVVVEEDRGIGATACSCHASEEDANKHCSGHKFADPVDVPWSVLVSLKPNAKNEGLTAPKENS